MSGQIRVTLDTGPDTAKIAAVSWVLDERQIKEQAIQTLNTVLDFIESGDFDRKLYYDIPE